MAGTRARGASQALDLQIELDLLTRYDLLLKSCDQNCCFITFPGAWHFHYLHLCLASQFLLFKFLSYHYSPKDDIEFTIVRETIRRKLEVSLFMLVSLIKTLKLSYLPCDQSNIGWKSKLYDVTPKCVVSFCISIYSVEQLYHEDKPFISCFLSGSM